MIDLVKARVLALNAAIEDYPGFFELLWESNTQWHEASEAEKLEIGRSTLAQLIEERLVVVYVGRWGADDLERVPHSRAVSLIADDASWKPPDANPESRYVAFGASEAGEHAFMALPAEAFEGLLGWGGQKRNTVPGHFFR